MRGRKQLIGLLIFSVAASTLWFGSSVAGNAPNRPIDRAKETGEPKIVDGKPAKPGEYPFQVALIGSGTQVGQEFDGQFCGGTLVAKRWVLTAAHCLADTEANEIDVVVGATKLASKKHGGGKTDKELEGLRIHVQRTFTHPKYAASTQDNDIALLQLLTPVPEKFTPVTVGNKQIESIHGADGKPVTVIGWGALKEGGDPSDKLMGVEVFVQPRAVCQQNYRDVVPTALVTENMWCAGVQDGGKDSCQGDSGGFIGVSLDKARFAQLGVVSWGIGCARKDLYGVYTRVANFTDWISQTQAQN